MPYCFISRRRACRMNFSSHCALRVRSRALPGQARKSSIPVTAIASTIVISRASPRATSSIPWLAKSSGMAGSDEQRKSGPPRCHHADAQPDSGRVLSARRDEAVFRSRSASLTAALTRPRTLRLQLETEFLLFGAKSLHLCDALPKPHSTRKQGKSERYPDQTGNGWWQTTCSNEASKFRGRFLCLGLRFCVRFFCCPF